MDYTDNCEQLKKEIQQYIQGNLKESRYQHTLRVVETAKDIALMTGEDPDKTEIAALLHDIAKNMPQEEMDEFVRRHEMDPHYMGNSNLAHSKIGAWMSKEIFGIEDEDILNAISYHTTGRAHMSRLEKIIFLSDAIEPGRTYRGVEQIRKIVWENRDIDQACLTSLEKTMQFVNYKGDYLDPDTACACDWLRKTMCE